MADTSRSDVDAIYGQRGMSDSDADTLVSQANRLADDVFSGQLRTLSEIEGNEKDFKTLLAAHLWTLREGEAQSESQTGGSITYNITTGDLKDGLSETRFGRMAQAYLRDSASVSVELARRR
jgi:hypothetical protein